MAEIDYLARIRAQKAKIKEAEAALQRESDVMGRLVAAARTARFPVDPIAQELDVNRETVRRIATEHGWRHEWGRQPGLNVSPDEARDRLVLALHGWLASHNKVQVRDLVDSAVQEWGRSESWLSRMLKSFREDGLLAGRGGWAGYTRTDTLANEAKAARRRETNRAKAAAAGEPAEPEEPSPALASVA